MNEDRNIQDESTGQEPELTGNKNIPEEETQHPTLKTQHGKQMEVHHSHHPTHKKKWTEYLLEFFMLFLAVFLGFVAENWREHISERNKEKELIRSLVNDLRADTWRMDLAIKLRVNILNKSDTLMELMTGPSLKDSGAAIYYFARLVSTRTQFQANTGAYEQLKSSAGLRLLAPIIVDSIERYYTLVTRYEQSIELETVEQQQYREQLGNLFDIKVFITMFPPRSAVDVNSFIIHRPVGNPKLLSYDQRTINNFCMKLHLWQRQSSGITFGQAGLSNLKRKAQNLVNLIQKEYHFKNE